MPPEPRRRDPIPRRIAVGLALIGMLLACFGRLAAHPSSLIVDPERPSLDRARLAPEAAPGNDLTRLFLPHHLAIARQVARLGHIPTWDDRGFGGRPMVGNPQAGLFYPPSWIAWWGGAPCLLGWITLGHLFWSGLGAYRLSRTLGEGSWGGLVAGGCVAMSPYVLAQTFEGHYPHVWAACWYPWAFDAAIALRRGAGHSDVSRPMVRLAAIMAAILLAGHPQEAYYLTIALGSWAAFDILATIGFGRAPRALAMGLGWAGASTLAVGLAAVELVPGVMALGWGLRRSRLPIESAGQYHLEVVNALQLLGPRALGGPADYLGHENYWESVLSIGLAPLVLAVVGLGWARDRRAARGWSLLVLGAIAFASGRKLGLFAVLYHLLPGMDRFRVPSRSLFLASLGLSMLAGLGVEALRSRASDDDARWRRLASRWAVVAAALALAIVAGRWASARIELSFARPETSTGRVPETARWILGLGRLSEQPTFWMALGGSTMALAWGVARPRDRRVAALILGGVGLIELGVNGHQLLKTSPPDHFLEPDPVGEALREHRSDGQGPPRIRAISALYDDLRAVLDGVAKTDVYDSFQIQHAADLHETLYRVFTPERDDRGRPMDAAVAAYRGEIRQAVLDRMAVSFLVADRERPDVPWPVVASGSSRGRPFVLLRNPSAMPRAYVVPRAEVAPDDASVVGRFREVDPRQAVLMPSDPLGPPNGPRQPFTPAEWTSDDPDRVTLQVTTRAPGLLVIADTWMPGWAAEVDGRTAPVLKGNRAQRVIPILEAGRHRIILTYHPPGLPLGLAITSLSAVIGLGLVSSHGLRRLSLTPFPRRDNLTDVRGNILVGRDRGEEAGISSIAPRPPHEARLEL